MQQSLTAALGSRRTSLISRDGHFLMLPQLLNCTLYNCCIMEEHAKYSGMHLVHESFPFPIALSWKGSAPDSHNGAAENQQTSIVFTKGNPIPSIKALTFYKSNTFSVDVMYADMGDLHVPAKLSTYTIGPFQSSKGERAKLKLKVRLNLHGIVSVDSATMLEEEEVVVPVTPVKEQPKEATKMETDETAQDSSMAENDVNMQDDNSTKDGQGVENENGAPVAGDKPVQMETDAKVVRAVLLMSSQSKIKTIAKEKLLSMDLNKFVGGMELGPKFGEVRIEIPVVGNEPLVRPFGRFKTIEEVIGRNIA